MVIPDYQSVMLPLLKLVTSSGKVTLRDAVGRICDKFDLTDAEAVQMPPSGNQKTIDNRVDWARTYLKKAGLLSYPQRGMIEVTDRGRQMLVASPTNINVKFLMQFPEFVEFQTPQQDGIDNVSTGLGWTQRYSGF